MVIVEVPPPLFEFLIRPVSDSFRVQLVTGKIPFPELTDPNIWIVVSKGKRPPKPHKFNAPGMTPAVWKIARKCWHQKAKERPEVNDVLQSLERLSNPGVCSRSVFLSGVGNN